MSSSSPPIDHAARQQAIGNHHCNLNVEAGAGTGKTTLLVERYVALMREQRVRASAVVAITFTEKAAAELRQRVRAKLGELGLDQVGEDLDGAPIATIHSFCATMLREHPFAVGIDPQFVVLDELAERIFLREAFDEWFAQALEDEPNPFLRITRAGISYQQVLTLAKELYRSRDLVSLQQEQEDGLAVTEFLAATQSRVLNLAAQAQQSCNDPADEAFRQIQWLAGELDHIVGAQASVQERALLRRLKLSGSKGKQAHWRSADECRRFKAEIKLLAKELQEFAASLRRDILHGCLRWLRPFVTFVQRRKHEQGYVDFDDLLLLGRNLLREHVAIRQQLQSRFRYLLVDEFQDTDPIQAELIWLLAQEPGSDGQRWLSQPLTAGKLFLVGDPKQSIYRFRKASIETYRQTTAALEKTGARLQVQQNFRSSAALINWVNQAFSKILAQDYRPLVAAGDPNEPTEKDVAAVLLLDSSREPQSSGSDAFRRWEAELIGESLSQLFQDESARVFDRQSQTYRPVRYSDVAILFPTSTGIERLEAVLRRLELPYGLDGGSLFFHRLEIHAARLLLQACLAPRNAIAVVGALRSVLVGLSDDDLYAWIAAGQTLDYRNHAPDRPEPMRQCMQTLHQLHNAAQFLSPSAWLTQMLEEMHAVPLSMQRFHGEQAAANLEKLVYLARRFEDQVEPSLWLFNQWLADSAEGKSQETDATLSGLDHNLVRLMTIHKSKGLEFPFVFLAQLGTQARVSQTVFADRMQQTLEVGIGPSKGRFCTQGYEAALEKEVAVDLDEKKRLLYVACTRAKQGLIMVDHARAKARKGTFWSVLQPGLVAAAALTEKRQLEAPPLSATDPAGQNEAQAAAPPFSVKEEWQRFETSQQAREAAIDRGVGLFTPSSEEEPADVGVLEHAYGRWQAKSFGSAFHEVMQHLDYRESASSLVLCQRAARVWGLSEQSQLRLQNLVTQVAGGDVWRTLAQAEQVLREVPFSVLVDGALIEGIIDLALQQAGRWTLIDYKTDAERVDPSTVMRRYAPQLRLYEKAWKALVNDQKVETYAYFVRGNTLLALSEWTEAEATKASG